MSNGDNAAKSFASEVPLKYSEFLWSLEKLKYKDYGPKMQERDWFQINPMEIILLGCKTLCTGCPAKRDQGSLVLVMEDLTPYLSDKPRFWIRLLEILLKTIEGQDVPLVMKHRCCSTLCDLWKFFSNAKSLFTVTCQVWLLSTFYQSLDGFLSGTDSGLGDIRLELETFVSELSAMREYAEQNILKAKSLLRNADPDLKLDLPLPDHISSECGLSRTGISILDKCLSEQFPSEQSVLPLHLVTKLQLSGDLLRGNFVDIVLGCVAKECDATDITVGNDVFCSLLSVMFDTCLNVDVVLSALLDVLIVASLRMGCGISLESKSSKEELYTHSSFAPLSSTEDRQIGLLVDILRKVEVSVKKWHEFVGQRRSRVAAGLLELVVVTLSRREIEEALNECAVFFHMPIFSLMQYACEGYLSDEPDELMVALLSYACALAETGISPINVLMTYLPNLFGPVFGIRSHKVSLELLKYGELAANSRNKGQLLGEGIQKIVNIYKLYQPLPVKQAAERHLLQRYESVCIALDIVRGILKHLEETTTDQVETHSNTATVISGHDGIEDWSASSNLCDSISDAVKSAVLDRNLSDGDIEDDTRLRQDLLLQLLQLANAMVMNGDDISYIFRSELPKLLHQVSPCAPALYGSSELVARYLPPLPLVKNANTWTGDKRKFGIHILDLAVRATMKDVATPFKMLGIVIPKMARNVDHLHFSDQDKITMVTDMCCMTSDAIDKGGNVEELISNGLDLISSLLEHTSSIEEFRDFVKQMLEHLLKPSQASVLFLIRHSAQKLMLCTGEEERERICKFFRKLIFKGRKNEIRCVYRTVCEDFGQEKYLFAREMMYRFSEGGLNGKQLVTLTDALVPILVLERAPVKRPGARTMIGEEEDPEEAERRVQEEKKREETMCKLLKPCVETLQSGLSQRFSKNVCDRVSKKVALISLFRTLFWNELDKLHTQSIEEIEAFFQSKLPSSLLHDAPMMSLLGTTATRLENMQVPRYAALKKHLVKVVEYLVSASTPETANPEEAFEFRSQSVQRFTLTLSWNKACYARLLECGYREQIWCEHIEDTVRTDGAFSLEENLRQSLLANFSQYSQLLLQMKIRHVDVDGDIVETQKLFSEDLTLTELKGRRALAVKTIDSRLGPSKEGLFQEKKIALLMKEDEIESSIEKQAQQPLKPQTFKCVLNTSFLDCMSCCGSNIIGCYAPNGEHCERPLEIGMRHDSAIISIYDASNVELENVEVLFCEEGMYVFKSYSNGHPFDTSQVWVSMFSKMLADPLVPAVIIPEGYPNDSTWKVLHQSVPTEVTGSILTCQFDASPEWITYYDHRPERIRCGKDIVLYPHFALKRQGSVLPQLLQRQRSKLTKDLAGMMFDSVIQDLLTDQKMQEFRVLGKVISLYISKLIQSGVRKGEILSSGFDYKKWKKSSGASSDFASFAKEDIVSVLQLFVDDRINAWLQDVHPAEFLSDNPKQAIELKIYLEKCLEKNKLQKSKYKELRSLLLKCTKCVEIRHLPMTLQVDIMHWIFNNEDRVWRYRGGRDRCETLQQYMKFLGHQAHHDSSGEQGPSIPPEKVFPGIAVFFCPSPCIGDGGGADRHSPTDGHHFRIKDLVGYAVGEVVVPVPTKEEHAHSDTHPADTRTAVTDETADEAPKTMDVYHPSNEEDVEVYCPQSEYYEVVTTWVHPNFRQLGLGVTMYYDIIREVPANLVVCDMLRGSVNRIIMSSMIFGLLRFLRLESLIVVHQDTSYTVDTQLGNTEQFERIAFRARPIRIALWLNFCISRVRSLMARVIPIFGQKW